MKQHRTLSVCMTLALLLILGGCAKPDHALFASVTIEVKGRNPEVIRVEYSLSEPVATLHFDRPAGDLREKTWVMETPGLLLKDNSVVSVDGKPFQHFSVRVEPYSGFDMTFDYAPAAIFSDGSIALYTGHFDIDSDVGKTRYRFVSSETPVVLFGKIISPSDSWVSDGMGTFVYYGQISPISTRNSTLIMDAGLPTWMHEVLAKVTPDAIESYSRGFGVPLGYSPFLLIDWTGRDDTHSKDLNGDTLRGAIRYRLSGASWSTDSVENREILSRVVSHEIAHFWNNSLFHPSQQEGGSWLAEGQSEAAALDISTRRGWVSMASALQRYSDLLTDCIHDPDPSPIARQQNEKAVYGCGVTFNLLAEADIARSGTTDGFDKLWRDVYAAAQAHSNQYTVSDFVSAIKQLSGDGQTGEVIRGLSENSSTQKQGLILKELTRLGVAYDLEAPEVDDWRHGQQAMQPLMASIMAKDCGGHARYEATHDSYRSKPVPGCHVFSTPYVITKMNGYSVFAQTALAYDAAIKSCAASHTVDLTVQDADKPLTATCPDSLPPMPLAVVIHSVP